MGKDLETGANNKTEETTETSFLKRQQNNNTTLTTLTSRHTEEVVSPEQRDTGEWAPHPHRPLHCQPLLGAGEEPGIRRGPETGGRAEGTRRLSLRPPWDDPSPPEGPVRLRNSCFIETPLQGTWDCQWEHSKSTWPPAFGWRLENLTSSHAFSVTLGSSDILFSKGRIFSVVEVGLPHVFISNSRWLEHHGIPLQGNRFSFSRQTPFVWK